MMKLKEGFVLHTVGEEYVVVPVGEQTKIFNGMIRLNSSGAYLWEHMQGEFTKESLVSALLRKYEVTEAVAADTAEAFLQSLLDGGVIVK